MSCGRCIQNMPPHPRSCPESPNRCNCGVAGAFVRTIRRRFGRMASLCPESRRGCCLCRHPLPRRLSCIGACGNLSGAVFGFRIRGSPLGVCLSEGRFVCLCKDTACRTAFQYLILSILSVPLRPGRFRLSGRGVRRMPFGFGRPSPEGCAEIPMQAVCRAVRIRRLPGVVREDRPSAGGAASGACRLSGLSAAAGRCASLSGILHRPLFEAVHHRLTCR